MKQILNFVWCLLFTTAIIMLGALIMQWSPYQKVINYFQNREHLLIIGALLWWILFVNVSDAFSNFKFRGATTLSLIFLIVWLVVAFGLGLTMILTSEGDPPW